jgi:hypothetical protein
LAFLLQGDQKVKLSIAPVDAAGNSAPVQNPQWLSTDPGVLTVEPSVDGLSASAVAVGPLGTAQVQVSADADLGSGVVALTGILDVQVVAGQAVSLGILAGTPEPK